AGARAGPRRGRGRRLGRPAGAVVPRGVLSGASSGLNRKIGSGTGRSTTRDRDGEPPGRGLTSREEAMGISIEFADDAEMQARIKVVGVGGGGGNALNTMIQSGLDGVEFIAANTDMQALEANLAPTKIQLGPALTKGLGAGANPDVGRKAALEDVQRVSEALEGADM